MTNAQRTRAFELAAQSFHGTNQFTKWEKERIITYLRERAGHYRRLALRGRPTRTGKMREIL